MYLGGTDKHTFPWQCCLHFRPSLRKFWYINFAHSIPLTVSTKSWYMKKNILSKSVFLNLRAVARYRALASITPGHERPEEATICYKISLVQLITNLNVILYLSTCHTVYISVLILFMITP